VGYEQAPDGNPQNGIQFWGQSFIADPWGEIIAKAGDTEEAVLMAESDLSIIDWKRKYWPFFRDRRIDAYVDLLKLYRD